MGRGNVCVHGPYEGLFYIDNDHFHVYRKDDPLSDWPETRLLRDLDYSDLAGGEWLFDDWGTSEEYDDIIECFLEKFLSRFPSFSRPRKNTWVRKGAYGDMSLQVLAESKLFYLCAEDNDWSEAIELIQKEDPWDDRLSGLQSRHYQSYLDGMRDALLHRLPSIGTYTGAWTSGVLKGDDIKA